MPILSFCSDAQTCAAQWRESDLMAIRRGYTCIAHKIDGDFQVRMYQLKQENDICAFHISEGDNFAAVSGPIWYKSQFGMAALKALLKDLNTNTKIEFENFFGNFAIVIKFSGVWHLLNDDLRQVKWYQNKSASLFSTSWLVAAAANGKITPNEFAIQQYVLYGSNHTTETNICEVTEVDQATPLAFPPLSKRFVVTAQTQSHKFNGVSENQHLEIIHEHLKLRFKMMSQVFGASIKAGLSGGFDSRLIAALLLEAKLDARYVVYGTESDSDVKIAQMICADLNLKLVHTDKSKFNLQQPALGWETLNSNMLFFDAFPVDGLFDRGADRLTRELHNSNGDLLLNGGGGEIFRNFFHLRDTSFSAADVFSTFYKSYLSSVFDSKVTGNRFAEQMISSITKSVQSTSLELSRPEIEKVYSIFRCVNWMARNNSIANQYGGFLTPLFDSFLVNYAAQLPIKLKDHGKFEAKLISRIFPKIARFRSDYGASMECPPSLTYRTRSIIDNFKPVALRPLPSRFKQAQQSHRDRVQNESRKLREFILPNTNYFQMNPAKLPDVDAIQRLASVNFVFKELDQGALPVLDSKRHLPEGL